MLKHETTNKAEAQRFRIAQFNGRIVTFASGAATVTGRVRSVQKSESGRWLITIVPSAPNVGAVATRGAQRFCRFSEEF